MPLAIFKKPFYLSNKLLNQALTIVDHAVHFVPLANILIGEQCIEKALHLIILYTDISHIMNSSWFLARETSVLAYLSIIKNCG